MPYLSLGQSLSTFHYTLLNKCRALLSVVDRGWPNALHFSLDLELNIPRVYYLMNNSFKECFVHYLMNSNCACVRSTTLDNFALDQTSLNKLQSSRLHSTGWPNALDMSLNMHVEHCIVKSRERLARALSKQVLTNTDRGMECKRKNARLPLWVTPQTLVSLSSRTGELLTSRSYLEAILRN